MVSKGINGISSITYQNYNIFPLPPNNNYYFSFLFFLSSLLCRVFEGRRKLSQKKNKKKARERKIDRERERERVWWLGFPVRFRCLPRAESPASVSVASKTLTLLSRARFGVGGGELSDGRRPGEVSF